MKKIIFKGETLYYETRETDSILHFKYTIFFRKFKTTIKKKWRWFGESTVISEPDDIVYCVWMDSDDPEISKDIWREELEKLYERRLFSSQRQQELDKGDLI